MRYYAKINSYATATSHGFANTWDVLVFSSRQARDQFVKNDSRLGTEVIRKSEVTKWAANYNTQICQYNKPKPFTQEYWGIDTYNEDESIGLIGNVAVCDDGRMERLF